MKFKEIAEVMSQEENKTVTLKAVKGVYTRAMKKLRKQLEEDEKLYQDLQDMISKEYKHTPKEIEIFLKALEERLD